MADPAKKLPPEYQEKARQLELALHAYLDDMQVLKSERREIIARFLKQVEQVKLEEAKRRLASL